MALNSVYVDRNAVTQFMMRLGSIFMSDFHDHIEMMWGRTPQIMFNPLFIFKIELHFLFALEKVTEMKHYYLPMQRTIHSET